MLLFFLTLKNRSLLNDDLILIDPPYRSGLYSSVLQKIYEKNILSQDGIIVCEHLGEEKFDDSPFDIVDKKRYGDTYLTFLTYKQ